jgi:hypothetical protein
MLEPSVIAIDEGSGKVLAGGGVLLRDFPQRLRAETGLPVQLVAEPLTCVAVGAGAAWTSSVRSPGRRGPRSAADTPDPAGSGLRGAVEPSLHALHGNSGSTQQPSDLEVTDRNLARGLG